MISAMRKVIERLQSENSSLKSRVRSSQNKVSALSGLEEENKRLKVSRGRGDWSRYSSVCVCVGGGGWSRLCGIVSVQMIR